MIAIPSYVFWIDLLAWVGIYFIISLSLNLEVGYTGIPNFGKVLAVAGGAFIVGYFPGRIAASLLGIGLPYGGGNIFIIIPKVNSMFGNNPAISLAIFFLTLLLAGGIGVVLGFVASYPAIKLRRMDLAIILLAMGEGIRIIGRNYEPLVGGAYGIIVPDPFCWAGEYRYLVSTLFIFCIALIVFFYVERLARTPLGRTLRAIRDNEGVAKSLGKDVTKIRIKSIVISSSIAAIAGALYAFHISYVASIAYSRVAWTFWPWVIIIIGGAANNLGTLLGTFVFAVSMRFIIFYKVYLASFVPFDVIWLDFLLLGVVFILILMYKPGGILPEKPTYTLNPEELKKIIKLKRE